MPAGRKSKAAKSAPPVAKEVLTNNDSFDEDREQLDTPKEDAAEFPEMGVDMLEGPATEKIKKVTTSRGVKRPAYNLELEEDDTTPPVCGGMQQMIATFGVDISKSLDAKRKRLETFTQDSVKTNTQKISELWKTQQGERQHLGDEYKKQSLSVFEQWETDLQKSKESEEKLQNLFKQQQKLFQQQRVVQSQRLKTIKQLHEQYLKGMEDLDTCHRKQQTSMQTEIKREMTLLQKKLLVETQRQEMSNVRRSLKHMLTEVDV